MVDINDNDTKNEIASAITFDIINTFPTKLKHIVIKLDEHKHSWELEDTILNAIENKLQQISKFNEVNNNSLDLAESIENEDEESIRLTKERNKYGGNWWARNINIHIDLVSRQ